MELEVADVWRSRAVETEGQETCLTHSYSCLPSHIFHGFESDDVGRHLDLYSSSGISTLSLGVLLGSGF